MDIITTVHDKYYGSSVDYICSTLDSMTQEQWKLLTNRIRQLFIENGKVGQHG
jgi:hypothetical protein